MSDTPLTIKAVNSRVTVSLKRNGCPTPLNLEILKNNEPLTGYFCLGFGIGNPCHDAIVLQKGDTLSIRNLNTVFSMTEVDCYNFIIDGSDIAKVQGNVMSLVNYSPTITAPHQFYKLFKDCVQADFDVELPATILRQSCYEKMFEGCLNLTKAPKLPANKLTNKCYKDMFRGCIALTKIPFLPAKELIFKCYSGMFEGCTNLKVITLPAQKLATKACSYMFYGCTKIRSVKAYFKQWVATATQNWLSTKCNGAFYKFNWLDEEYGPNRIPKSFRIVDLNKEPLTFTARKDYSSITLVQAGKPNVIDLYYSINDQNWIKYIPGRKLTLKKGDILQFRNNSPFFSIDEDNYYQFVMQGVIRVSGKVESLINFRGLSSGCFIYLFKGCVQLVNAPAKLQNLELVARCYEGMFWGCTSLIRGPVLPATKLDIRCYKDMFLGCENLTSIPTLPAIRLAPDCYEGMFHGCLSLKTVPFDALPAIYLKPQCYKDMFAYCTALQNAPVLPATNLATGCYARMFQYCESLMEPPDLPATTLKDNCYAQMFWECWNMIRPPELPATKLTDNCYCGMFRGCKEMAYAPQLPAKELTPGCYENMFQYCWKINDIVAGFEHWQEIERNTFNWLDCVAKCGTFHHSDLLNTGVVRDGSHIPPHWRMKHITYYNNPLTFTSVEESENKSKISLRKVGDPDPIRVSFKIDDGGWYDYNVGTELTLNKDQKISFVNDTESFSKDDKNYYYFAINDGQMIATGEVNSLIRTDVLQPYIFANLFKDCQSLVEPPQVHNNFLAPYCYYQMFYNCVNLKYIPELEAKILAQGCYLRMFYNCTSLTDVEIHDFDAAVMQKDVCKEMFGCCTNLSSAYIPYKYLAPGCFENMFANCQKLKTVRVEFENWYDKATVNWLANVPAYGVFVKPITLKTSAGTTRIPESWTTDVEDPLDTPLTFVMNGQTVIRLTAFGSPSCKLNELFYKVNNTTWTPYSLDQEITLQQGDIIQFRNYQNQFSTDRNNYYHFEFKSKNSVLVQGNIMSLCDFSDGILHEYQFAYLFVGCQNIVTAPILPATTLSQCCYYNMFNGCTHLTQAPVLPATELENKCYLQMFANCTLLQAIPNLPAPELKKCCYRGMFRNCLSLRAVELPRAKFSSEGGSYANMFNGCKNLNSVTVHFVDWDRREQNMCTTYWLKDVSPTGTFIKMECLCNQIDESHIPEGWTIVNKPIEP